MAVNRCGDCDFLNYRDKRWGDIWCNYKGYYVDPGSRACSNYTYHGHCYGRYLICATCNILEIPKEEQKKYFKAFDNVRDINTPEVEYMYDMITSYDVVGPMIADKLYQDRFRNVIATSMLEDYIKPCYNLVKEGKYLEAVNKYEIMTMTLYNFYFAVEKNIERKKKHFN